MSQEQRVWLASILSAIVLVAYAQALSRPAKPKQTPHHDELKAHQTPEQPQKLEDQPPRLVEDDELVVLESPTLRLELGKRQAAVRSVVLKQFEDLLAKRPLRVQVPSGIVVAGVDQLQEPWSLQDQRRSLAVWHGVGRDGLSYELRIELDERHPTFILTLSAQNPTESAQRIPLRTVALWSRNDEMAGRYNVLEAVMRTTKTSNWQRSHLRYAEGLREPKIVPRGTTMVTLAERFFCQSLKLDGTTQAQVRVLQSDRGTVAAELTASLTVPSGSRASYRLEAYLGPRDFFRLREAGFEQAFALGLLAKLGLILLIALRGLASIVRNYGVAIILLSAGVTAALSPFTLVSVRSMKKMQELQPRMDALRKKYADDTQRMNRETFALFKEHKVSPLSGCLPMLLQLPVFFALWSAISHVIELRGEPFLWIKDLSLPDRLARLPFGLDLNLLPILMAIAMWAQTKLSQPRVKSQGQNLFSGPLMSVMFGVMFYQVPAGLVLYWLTNSLMSVLWYRLAKV